MFGGGKAGGVVCHAKADHANRNKTNCESRKAKGLMAPSQIRKVVEGLIQGNYC
jgi:hypothetical protein